ncbi:synaptotagmin-like protein 2 isoform X2 [Stegostoma tigrinum]|uniref:synaptotagmin-like protein 2 isoform X2 n=1 Tax=Stegostoma tigrinum TaxID=3053191 RepID=UPI00202B9386|nr:synaptotagmin-like protein 2 isoform X2 [Stegostoma tigrinum]
MKTEMDLTKIVDLSFLSEEEQLALQQVLKRDAALRKLEESRIKKLKRNSFDMKKLKVMTGEWFTDVKAKRFGDLSSGMDILKNSFNRKKKIPVVQDVPVKASEDVNVFLSPNFQYQNVSSDPEALNPGERLLEEAEPVPQTSVTMLHSRLQATVDKNKAEDEARTWEDNIKPYMKKRNEDHEDMTPTLSNEVPLSNIDSPITAIDVPESETNPYSDYTVGQSTHSAKQEEFWAPKEDLNLQTPRKKLTVLDRLINKSDRPEFSPIETEATRWSDPSEQSVKYSPGPGFDGYEPTVPSSHADTVLTPAESSAHTKESSVSNRETPFHSEDNYDACNANKRQKNPFSMNSSKLLSEILQGVKNPQTDSSKNETNSDIIAEQNLINANVESKSPDMDSLFTSRSSDLKPVSTDTKISEPKGKRQEKDNIIDQRSEPDKPKDLMNNRTSQIKKPGEYSNDAPNLILGRGETEHSKRKGILKRTPSSSSTESENLSKWTSIRSMDDSGALPEQAEDSEGTSKTETGSKQVRFSAKMKTKPLTNITEGQKTDESHNFSLIMGEENSVPWQEDTNAGVYSSISQKYENEPDVDQILTDKGTTEQEHLPSQKWRDDSEAQQKSYQVPGNDSSDFSVRTNQLPSLPTANEVTASSLPSNDPQSEEYDYFDDVTSESSVGSDIMKQTDVHVGSNLQSSKLSGSLLSLYSDAGDFGEVPIQGAVQFKLHYEEAKKEFQIHVVQCRGLAVANMRKYTSDPYVKTYLLPDRTRPSKRKSSVKKASLNPQYNETLKYKIKKQELLNRTLNVSVWHNDILGRNVFLGETEVEMNSWDWRNNTPNWYTLQSKPSSLAEGNINRGEIRVALKYIPAESIDGIKPLSGEIHIWLKEATELQPVKPGGVDSFVRCYILPDTSKKSRQKTRIVKKSLNPIYNHTMVYDGFRLDEIMEACAELSIWDHETFTNQFLGGIRLNLGTGSSYGHHVDWMDSNEEEAAVWMDMISKPNQWVEAVLPLRSSMTKRK